MKTIKSIFCCLLCCLLMACKQYRVIEPDYDRSFTNYLVETTDDATKAANLPVLRKLPLNSEHAEIRIWVGFNAMILQGFYSIGLNDGLKGKKVWYFEPPWEQWNENDYNEFVDELYQSCDKIGTYNETEACKDTEFVIDWDAIYEELLELDVWNIPDESEIPKYVKNDVFILDGTLVLVEVKKAGLYRSYSHKYDPFASGKNPLYGNKILKILNANTK